MAASGSAFFPAKQEYIDGGGESKTKAVPPSLGEKETAQKAEISFY